MKKGPLIAASAALALLGYLAASPYLTASALKNAVDKGDGEKVASYIDYPLVRSNLKQDLNTAIDRQHQQQSKNTFGAGLSADIAKRVLNGMIDFIITPDNTVSIIRGVDPQEVATNPDISRSGEQTDIQDAVLAYRGLNRFDITVTNNEDQAVTLGMQRRFLTWKVTQIQLPEQYMELNQRL